MVGIHPWREPHRGDANRYRILPGFSQLAQLPLILDGMEHGGSLPVLENYEQPQPWRVHVQGEVKLELHGSPGVNSRRRVPVHAQIEHSDFRGRRVDVALVLDALMVHLNPFLQRTSNLQLASLQINTAGTKRLNRRHVMAYEENGTSFFRHIPHFP